MPKNNSTLPCCVDTGSFRNLNDFDQVLPTLNPLHADFLLSVSHCFCPQDNEIRAGICGSEVLKCLIQGGYRVESFQCYNVSRLMICS